MCTTTTVVRKGAVRTRPSAASFVHNYCGETGRGKD